MLNASHLIASCTSGLDFLGVVSPAVHLSISLVVEVYQVHEEFVAVIAGEAGRVPDTAGPHSTRHHHHLAYFDLLSTLLTFL